MRYVVAYDIQDNSIRTGVAEYLFSKGLTRIQKSVFMGDLRKAELREIVKVITSMTKKTEATIDFFSQCANCNTRHVTVEQIGIDEEEPDETEVTPEVEEVIPSEEESQEREEEQEENQEDNRREQKLIIRSEELFLNPSTITDFLIDGSFTPKTTRIKEGRKVVRPRKKTKVPIDLEGKVVLFL